MSHVVEDHHDEFTDFDVRTFYVFEEGRHCVSGGSGGVDLDQGPGGITLDESILMVEVFDEIGDGGGADVFNSVEATGANSKIGGRQVRQEVGHGLLGGGAEVSGKIGGTT